MLVSSPAPSRPEPRSPPLPSAVVKGRYAEKHVPKAVRDIISAESGANDGLGYPFLYIAITLMQSTTHGRSINESLQHWIVTTWLYQIFLSVAIGIVIGFLAAKTLKFAHARQLVDHESFLAYGVGLAFFTLGVVGVLGSDDVLACFVAGNSLTWNDFYRVEKHEHDDTFQDGEPSRLLSRSGKGLSANCCGLCPLSVIDGLLDTATFIYIGALLPCASLSHAGIRSRRGEADSALAQGPNSRPNTSSRGASSSSPSASSCSAACRP